MENEYINENNFEEIVLSKLFRMHCGLEIKLFQTQQEDSDQILEMMN